MVQLAVGKGGRKEKCNLTGLMVAPDMIKAMNITTSAIKATEATWHIHLKGLVQGVGFRPFVYQLAVESELVGAVSNGLDGLHIWINTSEKHAGLFLNAVLDRHPALARITSYQLQKKPYKPFHNFSIVEEEATTAPNLWITPDFSLCEACRTELNDPQSRRFQYPFITCTQCGPRYSIMQSLPFERHFTTMQDFPLCVDCQQEYDTPSDRRFYAQTISCADCGVKMEVFDAKGHLQQIPPGNIIGFIIQQLEAGNILAIKGIGGFLLLTDASNKASISTLRQRKNRPAKPFAIMYPSIFELENDLSVSAPERQWLTALEAPIVLLQVNETVKSKLALDVLAPGLDKLGVMLPYAPLLQLIAQNFGNPLVATSANISGAPILFKNTDALTGLAGIADFVVVNNRDIVAPQDDSVICFSEKTNTPILLRRSRGWAPAFPYYTTKKPETVIATGALLKSSFTLAHAQQVYISQYLGNTDSYDAQLAYRHTLNHLQELLCTVPTVVLCDKHPLYFSTQLAKEISIEKEIPLIDIQHHKAHFAAILGEHNLVNDPDTILGVVWDGTGIGDDGNSWGGEFFSYQNKSILRAYHFDYFPFLLGDKMAKEPRLSALAMLQTFCPQYEGLIENFTKNEWALYHKMLTNYSGIQTCSVGRIFDAVACLLSGISSQSYEGEAAMRLEVLARNWCHQNGYHMQESYFKAGGRDHSLPSQTLVSGVLSDMEQQKDKGFIAAKFHGSLVHLINIIAEEEKVKKIGCSGGVFQNSLLVDMMQMSLGKRYQLYLHQHLSPNDENISFGQLVYYDNDLN